MALASGKSKRSVLIQGAGIAGTALAWWLARSGHEVTVVERAKALRPGGYKIDVRGSAVAVLDRMGLYDEAANAKVGMNNATFVDGRGRPLATIDGDLYGMREGRDIELLRGDLARILYSAGSNDIDYRFAESIVSLEDRRKEVAVTFEKGQSQSFDLVVAADGLHSPVRKMVFGPEEKFLKYLGFHVSIYSVPNMLGLSHQEMACMLPGKRVVNYYTSDASGNAKVLFFFPSPQFDLNDKSVSERKVLLREYMSDELSDGQDWILSNLLKEADDCDDFYFDALAQIKMTSWSLGRIVLLGDAAWCASPASGQGCSLALVGAYILAHALNEGCPPTTENYEDRMRSFVAGNQEIADGFAKMLPNSKLGCWIGRQAIRLMNLKVGQHIFLRSTRRRFRAAANNVVLDR